MMNVKGGYGSAVSCIPLDPTEDTESSGNHPAGAIRQSVASRSIRPRILKGDRKCFLGTLPATSCIPLDPTEDTESPHQHFRNQRGFVRCIPLDPTEDTESGPGRLEPEL